jgi:hypothetical protein
VTSLNNNELKVQPIARLQALIHPYHTGRIRLFFLSVAIKLSALVVSGLGVYSFSVALCLPGMFLWLSWFVVILGVAIKATDNFLRRRLRWLEPAAITITIVILGAGLMWGVTVLTLNSGSSRDNVLIHFSKNIANSVGKIFSYDDATALWQQAGENLLNGRNPYTEANIITASFGHNVAGLQTTPLRRGIFANTFPYPDYNDLESFWQEAQKHPDVIPVEIESKYSYPAGSFLLLVPFLLAGIQDIRPIFLLFVLVSLAILIWQTRGDGKTVLILGILASLEIFTIVAMGDTGLMQFPFLLLGWVLWKKHWLASAILMGVAITIKQVSWIYLLFYLLLVFRETGPKRLLQTLGVAGGIFIASNLPFVALNPTVWISSMLAPVTDPLFPIGVGFISLVTSGLVTIKSSLLFDALTLAILIAGLIWYYYNCRIYPYLGPILAILPFFFAWRSLFGYFFYADLIALACIVTYEYSPNMKPVRS